MQKIDIKIREELNPEDNDVLDEYGRELGLFGLIAESFRTKFKSMVIAVFFFVLIFAVILIYSAICFFTAGDIDVKLNWLSIGFTALIVIGLLRLWYFQELARLSISREIKRLELQVALLAKKL